MKSYFFLPLILLFSCTATRITSSWTAPSAGNKNYQKILVVSVIQNEDSTMRNKMEEHMVTDLQSLGYNAVAYSGVFKQGTMKNMRYDSVRNRLTNLGIDGVITISLMAKEKESVYVKDKGTVKPDNLPMGSFWETPAVVRQEVGRPGYYITSTQYYWESNFYDVGTIDLLYNAKSTAFEVSSAKSLAHKYGKKIVDDMQKHYLLTAKN